MNPAEASAIATLARFAEPWRHAFSTSTVISTGVLFAHVSSLVSAGGLSLAADRGSLRLEMASDDERAHELRARSANRRLAIRALTVVALSGLLLFLSDVDSFIHLGTFWVKMSLVALLITNSLLAQRYDEQLCSAEPGAAPLRAGQWSRCRVHAFLSLTLWLVTLLAGTALLAG